MKIFKEILLKSKEGDKIIYFGMPDTSQELAEMFRLRYEVYLEWGYISKEAFPDGLEQDEYDKERKCYYFIAKIDNQIIGSARLIKDHHLPIKECFLFEEPEEMKKIPHEKKAEISRVVVKKYKIQNKFLPSHLIFLGLLDSIFHFAQKKDLRGGYSFIKKSLKEKLDKLKIPFHVIKHFTIIDSHRYLKGYRGYFENPKDPLVLIYYLRDEARKFFAKIFGNPKIFQKINEKRYKLRNISVYKILLYKLFQ